MVPCKVPLSAEISSSTWRNSARARLAWNAKTSPSGVGNMPFVVRSNRAILRLASSWLTAELTAGWVIFNTRATDGMWCNSTNVTKQISRCSLYKSEKIGAWIKLFLSLILALILVLASDNSAIARLARFNNVLPYTVANMPLGLRSNKGTPKLASNALIERVIADCARYNDSAARVIPPCSITAKKARICLKFKGVFIPECPCLILL